MKPLVWMRAIRDLGELPTARLAVLWALGFRMESDGSGFASQRQLADDAKVTGRTVTRATQWARQRDCLVQVQRGHRLGDGRSAASRWQLQQVTSDLLGHSQGDTSDTLGISQGDSRPSQGDTRTPPEVCNTEIRGRSHREPQGSAPVDADETTNLHRNLDATLAERQARECIGCRARFARRVPPDRLCRKCRTTQRQEEAS